jgi:hypothetical protein
MTMALAVSHEERLIMLSLLQSSSSNERSSVALRSSSGRVGNCFFAISVASALLAYRHFPDDPQNR